MFYTDFVTNVRNWSWIQSRWWWEECCNVDDWWISEEMGIGFCLIQSWRRERRWRSQNIIMGTRFRAIFFLPQIFILVSPMQQSKKERKKEMYLELYCNHDLRSNRNSPQCYREKLLHNTCRHFLELLRVPRVSPAAIFKSRHESMALITASWLFCSWIQRITALLIIWRARRRRKKMWHNRQQKLNSRRTPIKTAFQTERKRKSNKKERKKERKYRKVWGIRLPVLEHSRLFFAKTSKSSIS